jgi:Family of unknown function (DUF6247)
VLVTAELSSRAPTLADRVAYSRAHLPDEWREGYEGALREATRKALDSGDYGPLVDVVEQWWRAARLEHHGGEGWQRQKRLIAEGRWEELLPGPGRDVDEVVEELLR